MINPLQPHRYKPSLLSFPAYVQPRLSGGQRVIYQNGRFQDLEKDKSHDEILLPLSAIFAGHVILDGMLFPNGTFHVFDVVDYQKPFKQRMNSVYEVIRDTRHLHSILAVPSRRIKTMEEADRVYYSYPDNPPFSGAIYRIAPCLYLKSNAKHNRSWQLLERKSNDHGRTLSTAPLDRQKGG